MSTILEQYNIELAEDTKVDEINLKDVQMKLIANKHKWASRLIRAKQDLAKLIRLKETTIANISPIIQAESKVTLSDLALRRAAEKHQAYQKIVDSIDDQELLIEYLEKVEVIMKSMTYDIKNIIEIIKLELT